MDGQLQAPVALIVFNRPSHTARALARIREVKPQKLLLVADGPRPQKPGEDSLCAETRRIATQIDWPCQLETNFADHNMGCRNRVVSGLNWVFDLVEEAIILEDDILPDPSFFKFCEEMLARFRYDSRVFTIRGFNIVPDQIPAEYSYFFSHVTHIWGWASWRRCWSRYDQHVKRWPEIKASGVLREIFDEPGEVAFWTALFDQMYDGTGPDTWDHQWAYTNFIESGISVVPRVNLIENIGWGADATHTVNLAAKPDVKIGALNFPLLHPPSMIPLRSVDRRDRQLNGHVIPTMKQRIIRKWNRRLKKIGLPWNRPER